MAYVCSCHGINDQAVRAVISTGAATVDDVIAACSAGGNCGGCVPTIETLLSLERTLRCSDQREPAA